MKVLLLIFFSSVSLSICAQDIVHNWTIPISGEWTQTGAALKVDKNGFVYAVGNFEAVVDMDPGLDSTILATTGGFYSDIYVAKYDCASNLIWAKKISGIRLEKANELLLDEQNNIYIAGNYESTVDFDPSNIVDYRTAQGGQDCFIVKLDSNANMIWVNTYGGSGLDRMADIALTSDNAIVGIGDFQNSVNFEQTGTPNNLVSAGESDVFIIKLDTSGNLLWVKQLEGNMYDTGQSITVDENNNIYSIGNFESTVDFDPNPINTQLLTSFNNATPQVSITDIFILKLTPQGNYDWAKQIGGFGDNDASSIISDKQGTIYAAGSFEDQNIINYNLPNQDTLNSTDNFDSFIYSFDPNGSNKQIKHLAGPGSTLITNLHIDHNSELYTTGIYSFTTDFDLSSNNYFLTATHPNNAFVLKLNSQGDFDWARSIQSTQTSAGLDVQTDINNSIYLTGFWSLTADFDVRDDQEKKITARGTRAAYITKFNRCFSYIADTFKVSSCDSVVFRGNTYYETGYYEVVSFSKLGCDSVFILDLTINNISVNDISTTKENCPNKKDGTLTLTNKNDSYEYILTPGFSQLANNVFYGLNAQAYQLIIKDTNGCSFTQNVDIEKENCCDSPFLPNAFTPNNDGLNDDFGIKYLSDFEIKRFSVYNRFGNLVFENTSGWGWDGYYKSTPAEVGTYFYLLEYKCNASQKEYFLKGNVILMR